ncbi:hypothetical protein BU17DRAFT_75101 [Hysterangium stoloniferum]|nr:hypothetical protein BU17DRAFT_75101 [Hysterangium stoloniferum]
MKAKNIGLNGIEEPWWIDFPETDICKAVYPDVLHGLHKALNIIVLWNTNIVSKLELDARFRRLPKWPGFHHFTGVIAGAVPPEAIRATRAELDFIYLAQYQSHTDSTLLQLLKYNTVFHQNKNIFIKTGACKGKKGTINHFNIPKLHTHWHYPEFIQRFGATDNFSTETPEHYHIEYAKKAYKGVSKRDYAEQMVWWLDRQEKVKYFDR